MLPISQIRKGLAIVYENEPYIVLDEQHSKMGRAGAVVRTKIKGVKSGKVLEITFQGNDKIEEADLAYKRCQFLYADDKAAHFMDESYEQFALERNVVSDALSYLKEGQNADITVYEGQPVQIKLPPKVELAVSEAPPAVKGDTATNVQKTIKLETGLEILSPLFIKEGDVVRVNTETGQYVERV